MRIFMWKFDEDKTAPLITAKAHIESCHGSGDLSLPETAVLFYMRGGIEFMSENYDIRLISENFPSFLNSRPIYQVNGYNNLCFLHGGWGAPMAVDTLETLAAMGVKNIVTVGMFGAFGDNVESGDIIIPGKAFSEEGTSRHYYENLEFSEPDKELLDNAVSSLKAKSLSIVTTDAVYRQTVYKENLWREKGAVGVDMETSALFSVGKYLGVKVVSILIASDKHTIDENAQKWQWKMTPEMRKEFFEKCLSFALHI